MHRVQIWRCEKCKAERVYGLDAPEGRNAAAFIACKVEKTVRSHRFARLEGRDQWTDHTSRAGYNARIVDVKQTVK